jgi:hypothetical protein
MFGLTGVLAHQGGWDEMLLIALPIALFVLLLRIANSRAAAAAGPDGATEPEHHPAEDPAPDAEPDR